MSAEIAAMKKLCAEATPGPWVLDSIRDQGAPSWHVEGAVRWRGYTNVLNFDEDEATARFVAAHDPSVVEALWDVVEAAQEVEGWRSESETCRLCGWPRDGHDAAVLKGGCPMKQLRATLESLSRRRKNPVTHPEPKEAPRLEIAISNMPHLLDMTEKVLRDLPSVYAHSNGEAHTDVAWLVFALRRDVELLLAAVPAQEDLCP